MIYTSMNNSKPTMYLYFDSSQYHLRQEKYKVKRNIETFLLPHCQPYFIVSVLTAGIKKKLKTGFSWNLRSLAKMPEP